MSTLVAWPATENTLSIAADEAGIAKISHANFDNVGNNEDLSIQNFNGSLTFEKLDSCLKYVLTSSSTDKIVAIATCFGCIPFHLK